MSLMAIAMLTVPIVDSAAKYLSADYSPYFIAWSRYAIASLIILPVTWKLHGRSLFPSHDLITHLLRTTFLVIAMTLYFLAIAKIPIAQAVSIYFVGPIIAVALSVLVLGEAMTSRKGLSLVFGLIGALVILCPTGTFEASMILAFGAGIFFAFYLVATKRASQNSDPLKTLAFQCLVGTLLLTPQAVWTASVPEIDVLWLFVILGLFSAVSHLLTIIAFRIADASTLAPLVYLELVGSAVIGLTIFSEVPSVATIAGATFIVFSGLLLTNYLKFRKC